MPKHRKDTKFNLFIKTMTFVLIATFGLGLSACSTDAEVASHNVSKACDNFECQRRIVVFNGITDNYLMVIEGVCSIDDGGNQLEITCKTGPGQYKKSFAGLSDNVSYFVEQGAPVRASAYNYRVTFKPQEILPDPDFRGSASDGLRSQP